MKKTTLIASGVIALATMILWAPPSEAYETYSAGKVLGPGERGMEPVGNCKTCHGNFRATNAENSTIFLRDEYVSPTDGKVWSETYTSVEPGSEAEEEIGLHDIHRHVMLDEGNPRGVGPSACDVCHLDGGRYPVVLNSSATDWFAVGGISCMGCHGRLEDAGGDDLSEGLGAGLRQHHTNAGVTECKTCHLDADPAEYTPVGENVLPPYYSPDAEFVNKPTDPCNQRRAEDSAAGAKGLDNDGDGRYDMGDSDCTPVGHRKNRRHRDDDDDDA